MRLVTIGLNFKKSPIDLREALAFEGERAAAFSRSLISVGVIDEALILVTCNRTEVYAVGPCVEGMMETIYSLLARESERKVQEIRECSYSHEGSGALTHLFRVASSLDSMVVGEAQILGQLKSAYQAAVSAGTAGPYLHKACHATFRVAKKVRTETKIAQNAISIGTLAASLVERGTNGLAGRTILIIGAGEMGSLVAQRFRERGAGKLIVTNRTALAAEELAMSVGGEAVPFDAWERNLASADIVATSTGGGVFIRKGHLEKAAAKRCGRLLVIVDLAMPRNVEAADVEGISIYDIGDLESLAEKNIEARKSAAEEAEVMIRDEALSAFHDLQNIKLAPLIKGIIDRSRNVMMSELENFYARHPGLGEAEKISARECAEAIVGKILHDPIRLAKEELARPGANGKGITSTLEKLFDQGD